VIALIQPFGLQSKGGGPRIYRALVENAPQPWLSVCTGLEAAPPTKLGEEIHLPYRPHFGRIETTRFKGSIDTFNGVFSNRFEKSLEKLARDRQVTGIHGLAHDFDFWPAYQVAKKLKVPYFLSVHDDLLYALKHSPRVGEAEKGLKEAWLAAKERYVISEAMGREYVRRYGQASYEIVTDGVDDVKDAPLARPDSTRVYFMGLFHRSYAQNWRSLAIAMEGLAKEKSAADVTLTARCESLPADATSAGLPAKVLPFGSEQDVAKDMESADALYLPLPFEPDYELFVRFSLSTKMVTYLGSGLPILFHGPKDSAAGELLSSRGAAICVTSLDPAEIQAQLRELPAKRTQVVENALKLARDSFNVADIRRRFWSAMA
jgi:hypothetical protein